MTETTETSTARSANQPPFSAVFLHDWLDVTMIHFAIEQTKLQPVVPFTLDTFEGRAYVSLVLFRLDRMRLTRCERLSRCLLRPISDHHFLNIRTYVRHQGEPGIHFITEWLDNRLSVLLGPACYGLPYRLGRFDKHVVSAPQGGLAYALQPTDSAYHPCDPGSLDAFLMERYSAFTLGRGRHRVFRIRHEPWLQRPVQIDLTDTSLLSAATPWFNHAQPISAHQSPGLIGVEISRPRNLPDDHYKGAQ